LAADIAKHKIVGKSCLYKNADQTVGLLFYGKLPNRMYVKKGTEKQQYAGTKAMSRAKDRVVPLMVCCTNAAGERKVPLAMVGKCKKPNVCFPGSTLGMMASCH
jgi:hypothetical protein